MISCGLIVEYNPFHNGHQYHLDESKRVTNADCIIAVMSGDFLQRGEPAIINKWERASIALQSGVDLVIELPYVYAVQNSDRFAEGAVQLLEALDTNYLCFGSEKGTIDPFINTYTLQKEKKSEFEELHLQFIQQGLSFPQAAKQAYSQIGISEQTIDLTQPNNILGYSYVKQILDNSYNMKPLTIQRTKSHYHDPFIADKIASATSIRKEIFTHQEITNLAKVAIPKTTYQTLTSYYEEYGRWHEWEAYFPLLHYKILTSSTDELSKFLGVDEGIEFRLKETALTSKNFENWVNLLKTKRYTWTRLQRMFTHILTGTKKDEVAYSLPKIPYVRVLGMDDIGQKYLRYVKDRIEIPVIHPLHHSDHWIAEIEKKATAAYTSVLPISLKQKQLQREYQPPIRLGKVMK
ncbi:nucleotidyltransferase [Bacillaceae bacterium S4-13-58]